MTKKKREFYNKYGTEEEFREKYHHTQHTHHHNEEDFDPFDLFNMFFGGGMNGEFQFNRRRGNRVFVRREQNENQNQQNPDNQRGRWYILFQVIPLLLIMFSWIIGGLVNWKSTPVFSFSPSETYYKKMTTHMNRVHYYAGDIFIDTYK